MVTMRQYEFSIEEGENKFDITEKLVSESFKMKDKKIQGGFEIDIY